MSNLTPVAFHGQTLHVATIDGTPSVALRPVCEAIGLDWKSQYARIKRHPVLSESVVIMTTQLPGDTQTREVTFIPLDKLNGWLFGIHASRAKPELRERLIQYQRECFDVLARHFGAASESRPYAVLPGQTLSAEQADLLRTMLTDAAKGLPQAQQGGFLRQGWSKLKAHFGVPYREIPASQFSEAVSIVARHAVPTVPALPAPEPTATLDAHALYSLWGFIAHFRHIHRIYKQYNLYTHLTGLGSRAGIEMHDHFWHGLTSASALERKFEKPLKAASRYLREKHGLNTGDLP